MHITTKFFDEMRIVQELVDKHPELSNEDAIAHCSSFLEYDAIDLSYVLWYCRLVRESHRSEQITTRAMHWMHQFPDSVALVHEVCWAFLDQDESFKADRLIRAALKAHSDELILWCNLASVQINMDQMSKANDCIEFVLGRDAKFAEALRIKARIAIKRGDQEGALDAVNQSLLEDPRNVDGLIMRGIIQDFGADQRKSVAKHVHTNPLINILYVLFVVGKNLCGLTGAILWLLFVILMWLGDLGNHLDKWQDWILAPQILILIALIGWALMFSTGSMIHHKLNTKDHRPLWKLDWIWTLVPILTWLLFTSIRYLLNEGFFSYAMDFVRSLAFCSIFPVYLWRRLRTENGFASKLALTSWVFIILFFVFGFLFDYTWLFGVGYNFSAAIALIYICVRGKW